jgi:hypothetical protein
MTADGVPLRQIPRTGRFPSRQIPRASTSITLNELNVLRPGRFAQVDIRELPCDRIWNPSRAIVSVGLPNRQKRRSVLRERVANLREVSDGFHPELPTTD